MRLAPVSLSSHCERFTTSDPNPNHSPAEVGLECGKGNNSEGKGMYTIDSNTLKAALTHAAKNDVRFYLNGVCMDLDAGRIVASDGHRLFVAFGPKDPGKGQVILPRDLVASVCKLAGKRGMQVTVTLAGSGSEATATLALPTGASFGETLIDGRFPDWQRVMPAEMSGQPGQYNPDYLAAAADALVIHGAAAKPEGIRIAHNGADKACIVYAPGQSDNFAFVVVMPLRDNGEKIGQELATFIGVRV